MESIGKSCSTL